MQLRWHILSRLENLIRALALLLENEQADSCLVLLGANAYQVPVAEQLILLLAMRGHRCRGHGSRGHCIGCGALLPVRAPRILQLLMLLLRLDNPLIRQLLHLLLMRLLGHLWIKRHALVRRRGSRLLLIGGSLLLLRGSVLEVRRALLLRRALDPLSLLMLLKLLLELHLLLLLELLLLKQLCLVIKH